MSNNNDRNTSRGKSIAAELILLSSSPRAKRDEIFPSHHLNVHAKHLEERVRQHSE